MYIFIYVGILKHAQTYICQKIPVGSDYINDPCLITMWCPDFPTK